MTILKVDGYIHCLCSSGLPGEVNDEIAMNITFINGKFSCSGPCNSELYQPQLPCIWNNVTWNETTGTCTGIMDMSTPSDTDLCCCVTDSVNGSTINSTVSTCEGLSNEKGGNTILGFAVGFAVGFIVIVIAIALIAVYIRRKKVDRRRDYNHSMQLQCTFATQHILVLY